MMPRMKNLKLIPMMMVLLFLTAGLHAQDKGE